MEKEKKNINWNVILVITAVFAFLSVAVLAAGYMNKHAEPDPTAPPEPTEPAKYTVMENFDQIIGEKLAESYDAALDVKKVFWIEDDAELAPKPNESCYGEATDPKSLQWLIDDAEEILDGQELLFSTDIEIFPDSKITYYLDETIFVITWQQLVNNYVYTFSEVKITHPSQFRRYLANNEYDSDYLYPVSKMCTMTNAVMASSADYYRGRNHGIIVYDGEVKRANFSDRVDTCFIDRNGDLILVPAGELIGMEAAQAFVDEHNIDFSVAFGPILVDNGERCEPEYYYLGESNDEYPRAALCQKDKLHYLVVVANGTSGYWRSITIHTFAEQITKLNCQKAYALDGGKTGAIAMRGKALNPLQDGYERRLSDILYFATAIPSPEEVPEPTEP